MADNPKVYETERRGTRVRAQVPFLLTSTNPAMNFSELCQTVIVNPQGCGVQMSRPLDVGLEVQLDGLPCGKSIHAHVASCVSMRSSWLIGLALNQEEVGNVWGIHPAPDDWSVASETLPTANAVDSRGTSSKGPAKKDEWPYAMFSSRGEFHPGRK